MLNYRGGSFAFPYSATFEKECKTRGVSFETLSDAAFDNLFGSLDSEADGDVVEYDQEADIENQINNLAEATSKIADQAKDLDLDLDFFKD